MSMTYEEFTALVESKNAPSSSWPGPLRALWYAHKGNWEKAHRTAQDIPTQDGSWIHAYLHREEGDHNNARYWYSMACRSPSRASLSEELEDITRQLVERSQ